MNDPARIDEDVPEEFDEHIEYLGNLIVEVTPEDEAKRAEIFAAIEELVTNVDGGVWAGCRVCWTDDIPDTPEGLA